MATRWAICGSGKISNDFSLCITSLPDSEHKIVAVAASTKDKAETFAKQFGIPQSYGSYKELASLDDVDAVYVGTIHTLHVETCLMYINAGKHVLCEKPMSLTLEGCQSVLKAAKEKGVLFMEACWSRFFPVYAAIRDQVSSGAIGEVKVVQANFTIPIADVPRIKHKAMGGGALMDIGIYPIQAATMVLKGMPKSILSEVTLNEEGVDKTGIITLQYDDGSLASLSYSSETQGGDNFLIIRGTKGTLKIPDNFWCPTSLVMYDGEVKEFSLPKVKNSEKFNYGNSQGLTYEAQCFRECLLKGHKECPLMSHKDSEIIMTICKIIHDKAGITYTPGM